MQYHKVIQYPPHFAALAFPEGVMWSTFGIIDRYINRSCPARKNSDRLFNLNERASVGMLAGGIWLANQTNLVVEEYSTTKTSTVTGRGRNDIWFIADG